MRNENLQLLTYHWYKVPFHTIGIRFNLPFDGCLMEKMGWWTMVGGENRATTWAGHPCSTEAEASCLAVKNGHCDAGSQMIVGCDVVHVWQLWVQPLVGDLSHSAAGLPMKLGMKLVIFVEFL